MGTENTESGAAREMVGYYGGEQPQRGGHHSRPQSAHEPGGGAQQSARGEVRTTPAGRNAKRTTRRIERRGRGIRGPLIPQGLPGWKSRSEKFDAAALAAFAPIDARWHKQLTKLDIAVDDVPLIHALNPDSVNWPPEIVADGAVPLSRLVPAGLDRNGDTTRARIVLFRRPLELRAKHPSELAQLLHEVLVEQVATYLGVDPDDVDPGFDEDADESD